MGVGACVGKVSCRVRSISGGSATIRNAPQIAAATSPALKLSMLTVSSKLKPCLLLARFVSLLKNEAAMKSAGTTMAPCTSPSIIWTGVQRAP